MRRSITKFVYSLLLAMLVASGSLWATAPSTQSKYITFSSVQYNAANVSWMRGNGYGRFLVVSYGGAVNWNDFETNYLASAVLGNVIDADGNFSSALANNANHYNPGAGALHYVVVDKLIGAERSSSLSNLAEKTDYAVHVFEYNIAGAATTGEFSGDNSQVNNPRTLTTPTNTSTNTIARLAGFGKGVTGVYGADAGMQWTELNANDSYYLYISEASGNTGGANASIAAFNSNLVSGYDGVDVGTDESFIATMPEAKTYYVRIKSFQGSKVSAYSAEYSFTISDITPPSITSVAFNATNDVLTVVFNEQVTVNNDGTAGLITDGNLATTISFVNNGNPQVFTLSNPVIGNDGAGTNNKYTFDVVTSYTTNNTIASARLIGTETVTFSQLLNHITLYDLNGNQMAYNASATCHPNAATVVRDPANNTVQPYYIYTTIAKALAASADNDGIVLKDAEPYTESNTVDKVITIKDDGGATNAIVNGTFTFNGALASSSFTIDGITMSSVGAPTSCVIANQGVLYVRNDTINYDNGDKAININGGSHDIFNIGRQNDGLTSAPNTFNRIGNGASASAIYIKNGSVFAPATNALVCQNAFNSGVGASNSADKIIYINLDNSTAAVATDFYFDNNTINANQLGDAFYFTKDVGANRIIDELFIRTNTFGNTGKSIAFDNAVDLTGHLTFIDLGGLSSVGNGNTNSNGMSVTSKYVFSRPTLDDSRWLYTGVAVWSNDNDMANDQDGNDVAYNSIASAIAASNADGSETIYLGQGTYTEAITLTEAVNIVGKGMNSTTGTVLTAANTINLNTTLTNNTTISYVYVAPTSDNCILNANQAIIAGGQTLTFDHVYFLPAEGAFLADIFNDGLAPSVTQAGNLTFSNCTMDEQAGTNAGQWGIHFNGGRWTGNRTFTSNAFILESDVATATIDKGVIFNTNNNINPSSGAIIFEGNAFTGGGYGILFVDNASQHGANGITGPIVIKNGNDFNQTTGYGIRLENMGNLLTTMPNVIELWATSVNQHLTASDIYGAAWYALTSGNNNDILYPSIDYAGKHPAGGLTELFIGEGSYKEDVAILNLSQVAKITGQAGVTCELAEGYTLSIAKDLAWEGAALSTDAYFHAPTVVLAHSSANISDANAFVSSTGTINIAGATTVAEASATIDKACTIGEVAAGGAYSGSLTIATGNVTVHNLDFTGNPAITVEPSIGLSNPISITGNAFTLASPGVGISVEAGNMTTSGVIALSITNNTFGGGNASSKAIDFKNTKTGFANYSAVNVNGNTFANTGNIFDRTCSANLSTYLPSVNTTGGNTYTNTSIHGFYYSLPLGVGTTALYTDCTFPTAFTTGAIASTGSANLVPRYYNHNNTGIDVTIPIANDPSLTNGTVQIEIDNGGNNTWVNLNSITDPRFPLATPTTITSGMLGHNLTINFTEADLAATTDFGEGSTIQFRAVLTDMASNGTTGAASPDDIKRDETAPVTLLNSSTAGAVVNIAEHSADITVRAQANENLTTLYLVDVTATPTPDFSTITSDAILSKSAPVFNTEYDIVITSGTNLVNTHTYSIFAKDAAGNVSIASVGSYNSGAFTTDFTAPATPAITSINGGATINNAGKAAVPAIFTYTDVDVATYTYAYTTSGGAGSIGAADVVAGASPVTIPNANLTSLADGTITLTVSVKDANGNPSATTTATKAKDVGVPSGYTVTINQGSYINNSTKAAVGFTFAGAEVGTRYNYTFADAGSVNTVTGSGDIATATDAIAGINLTSLNDGAITLSVTLTDAALNVGAPATANATKDVSAPTAFAITSAATTGGNVVNNFWNSTNTGFTVRVPVSTNIADPSLLTGNVLVQYAKNGGTWTNLTAAHTIDASDQTATYYEFTAVPFDDAGFVYGDVISFQAIITDKASNATTSNAFATTFTVDQALPVVTINADGVTETAGADANTLNDLIINIAEKANGFGINATSTEGTGTLYLVNVTAYPVGTDYSNVATRAFASQASAGISVSTTITVPSASASIVNDGVYKVYATDAAGNLSAVSAGSGIATDLVQPYISSFIAWPNGEIQNGLKGIGGTVWLQMPTNEEINITGYPRIKTNAGANAYFVYNGLQWLNGQGKRAEWHATYTVAEGESTGTNAFTIDPAALTIDLNGGTIKDGAGNPIVTNIVTNLPNMSTDYLAATDITIDGVKPTFTIQWYREIGFSSTFADDQAFSTTNNDGYLKVVSSEPINGNVTLSIVSQGDQNNLTNVNLTHVSGNIYRYYRTINNDPLCDGTVRDIMTIRGTDVAGNQVIATTANNYITPAGTAFHKEMYIDTKVPDFNVQYYSDATCTSSLGNNPYLKAGTYYIKVTSTENNCNFTIGFNHF